MVGRDGLSNSTLQLERPSSRVIALTALFLGVFVSAAEFIVRQPQVQANLPFPGLNGQHRQMERQWHRLEVLTRSGVNIDCIALGNSMVLNGFIPAVFDREFYEGSGERISCFNFGVDGMSPVSTSALAQILMETYHPRLLVFGTDARDFAVAQDSWENTVFTDMSWIQYRLGRFNVPGWLVDHSYLYRYRYVLADMMRLSIQKGQYATSSQYGFESTDDVFPVNLPPNPNDPAYQIQYYYSILDNYSVLPENQIALRQILAQQDETTTIVAVEMPVTDSYFRFFDDPAADYDEFLDVLRTTTTEYHVQLLETTHLDLIPDDGWMDYSHLNNKGAVVFSEWLGQEIGGLVSEQKIPLHDSIH